jgi:hypothetical protein
MQKDEIVATIMAICSLLTKRDIGAKEATDAYNNAIKRIGAYRPS